MAQVKAKGSILYEILIVVLIIALIGTILYPKHIWQKEADNTKKCRNNIERILKAELIYLKYHNSYEDTLEKVFSFITEDTTRQRIVEYVYADTALGEKILKDLTGLDPVADNKIKTYLADTLLYTILETTKYDSNLASAILNRLVNTRMKDAIRVLREKDSTDVWVLRDLIKNYSVLDIINPIKEDDSLKLVLARIEPEISAGALVDTLYKKQVWADKVDRAVKDVFEAIKQCPTNHHPYKITVVDTSVIKVLNIYCPIDSHDIESIKKNFILYYIGHLRLENHGNIEAGEKSWLSLP